MSLTSLKFTLEDKLTLPSVPAKFLQCSWLEDGELSDDEFIQKPLLAITPVHSAEVKKVTLLTKGNDVKHKLQISLNTENFDCSYLPGDTIGVFPINPCSEVDELIDLLNLKEKASEAFSITVLPETTKKNASVPKHLPPKTTLRDLLSRHVEIRTPVKKLFLSSLSSHTVDGKERRRLEELCSKEGAEDYTKFILLENLTLLAILKSFKTCKPPISVLLEHLPAIKPRVYSVASSPLRNDKELDIVVTLVELDSGVKGVCSGYFNSFIPKPASIEKQIEQLNINNDSEATNSMNKVCMYFRQPNNFRYPENPTNLILVGAGSGLAPFIGFLSHKMALNLDSTFETWLFFGCRNESDYLFRDSLSKFHSCGLLTKLFVSFSRASDSLKYVQDNILSVKEEFINLLLSDTRMYICGDAKNMIKDVLSAVKSCLQQVKGLNESEAESKVKEMIKSGIIVTDSWV